MADITLQKLNLVNGDILTQEHIEKIDSNTDITQNKINENSNKIGDLTGLTYTNLADNVKKNTTDLSQIPNQSYITEKAKIVDVNNALVLKADKNNLDAEIINRTNAVSNEKIERQAEIAIERARINSFTALASGSTTGDAELIDARIGQDGVTYANAGTATRTQFANTNNKIDSFSNLKKITMLPNFIDLSGSIGTTVSLTPTTDSAWKYAIVNCVEGDLFTLNGRGGIAPRLWGFLDSNNVLISKSCPILTLKNKVIRAPANSAKLIINTAYSLDNYIGENSINSTKDNINYTVTGTGKDLMRYMRGGAIHLNANIGEVVDLTIQDSNYFIHVLLNCSEGQKFKINGTGGVSPKLWGFLDASNKLLSTQINNISNNVNTILTVPKNATKFIANFNTENDKIAELFEYNVDNIYDKSKEVDYSTNVLERIPEVTLSSFINGIKFAEELNNNIADFKKDGDLMVHVPNFCIINNIVYATHLVNTRHATETPTEHTARFVYFSLIDTNNKTYINLQDVGDTFNGKTVIEIYETILLKKDDDTLYLMWNAKMNDGIHYRLYRTYIISTNALSDIYTNSFKVGNTTKEFTDVGLTTALTINNIIPNRTCTGYIGMMPRLTTRVENNVTYYYTGVNVGYFNCIVKSQDLITWEFVAQPDFSHNNSQWENSVYVSGNRAYYFSRQTWNISIGILTYYDLNAKTWYRPVYVNDTQCRSDFFEDNGILYLAHAPNDRNHISIMQINKDILEKSYDVQVAYIPNAIFPYTQIYNNELYMSFVANDRKNIYLSKFTIRSIYISTIIDKFKELFSI